MSDEHFYSLDGPLEAMPTERQMRIANLNGFARLVRDRGADPRSLLERHDIDPYLVRDPDHYVDCKSVVDLLEDCSTTLNDSLFGLQLASQQDPDIYGAVTALCRSAATVREAMTCFIDYIPITHSPATILELAEGTEVAELRWCVRTDLGQNKQANYQAAMLNIKLLNQISGSEFKPRYVNLAVDTRHRDIAELERKLGCRFHATNAENAIAFPAEMLEHRISSANRLLFKLVGGYLEQVKIASRISTMERVQDYIRGSLHSGHCSIERCAEQLAMSVRTLQARLGETGHRFSDILEQQRMDLAKVYLRQQQITLDEVAANLGYAEQSSFGRAFKRWTGVTPKQFRGGVG